jgi:hypothetical protein
MTTLIAVYQGDRMIGRCDARCYQARSHACKCVCHGNNHAAGYARALEQTLRHGQAWLDRYLAERSLTRDGITVTGRGLTQLEMPLDDSGLPSRRALAAAGAPDYSFWTVHADPIDRPGLLLARCWTVERGRVRPTRREIAAPNLHALRAGMPRGLVALPPAAGDPATVREVWVGREIASGWLTSRGA